MKTKNNVQKTFLRTIAVIVSFVLLSFTVTAQGYWKQWFTNSTFNHLASALVEVKTVENVYDGTPANMDLYDLENENKLEIEPWMLKTTAHGNGYESEVVLEEILNMEDWMVADHIQSQMFEKDKPLHLESWMLVSGTRIN